MDSPGISTGRHQQRAPVLPHFMAYWQQLRSASGAWLIWQLLPLLAAAWALSQWEDLQQPAPFAIYCWTLPYAIFIIILNLVIAVRDVLELELAGLPPLWTPLTVGHALLNICLAGLLRSAPAALCLVCLLSFDNAAPVPSPLLPDPVLWNTGACVVAVAARLLPLALCTICIMCAYRKTSLYSWIPALSAAIGAALVGWGLGSLFSYDYTAYYPRDDAADYSALYIFVVVVLMSILLDAFLGSRQLKRPRVFLLCGGLLIGAALVQFSSWSAVVLLCALGTLLLVQGLLEDAASQRPWSLSMFVFSALTVLLGATALYTLIATYRHVATYVYGIQLPGVLFTPVLTGIRFGLEQVFPGLSPELYAIDFRLAPSSPYFLLRNPTDWRAFVITPIFYLVSCVTWWMCAQQCLKAARE